MNQCLQNYIGTSALADVSYLLADVEPNFFVYKCTEHQPKSCYWRMLMNIVSQMMNEWNFKLSLNTFICENAFIWKCCMSV